MSHHISTDEVLSEIAAMIADVLADFGPCSVEVGPETRFTDDLELESIDLVTLAGKLQERWGDRINFAEFIAGKKLDEIIALTVGQLVEYVSERLAMAEQAAP